MGQRDGVGSAKAEGNATKGGVAFIPQVSELPLFHLSPEDLKCMIGLDVCREKDKAVEGGGWRPRAGEAVGGQWAAA